MIHILKLNTAYWDAIASGQKTFEVRRDDRGFQKGDTVTLCRWGKAPNAVGNAYLKTLSNGEYWGTETPSDCNKMTFEIGWIMTGGQFGIEPGYIVFSLKPFNTEEEAEGRTK